MERVIIKEGKFLIVEEKNWINRICVIKLCDGDKRLALSEISTVEMKNTGKKVMAWCERYGFIESNDGSYPLVRPYKTKTLV